MGTTGDGERLRFAASLRLDRGDAGDAMETICSLLAEDLNREVEGVAARSPSHLAEVLGQREADLGWVSPTLLLMAPELATMVPLLSSVRQGVASYHSIVFTSGAAAITSIDELSADTAAWVAPTSAAGYLVPRLTLARLGVDLDRAFEQELFVENHEGVGEAVFDGRAAVGGTYAHFELGDPDRDLIRAGYQAARPLSEGRILAVSGPIPADMIVAHPNVPIIDRIAFAAALCRLVHDPVGGAPIERVIGAEDFAPVSVEVLHELQSLMQAAEALA
jgi:ABC-type phosphate/phosphonate transport system substrate-binding protein